MIKAYLSITAGTNQGHNYVLRLGQTFIVGRANNVAITLDDPLVSRQHTSLQLTPDGLLVTDLGSTNGTTLNYKKLDPNIPQFTRTNDTLHIGKHVITVRLTGLDNKAIFDTQILDQPLFLSSDEFQILGEIGRGANGVVFAAHQKLLKRNVAIKVPKSGIENYEIVRQRFLREAQICCKINSPFIATIYDLKLEKARLYIVMELVDGVSLKDQINNGPMSFYDITKIGENIALALNSIHRHHIIHRDIKPGNIVVTPEGVAKLIDFGIAKNLDQNSIAECITPSDEGVGTLSYVSPEGISSRKLGPCSDIYSFGATLYHMVAGVPPFIDDLFESVATTLEKVLSADPQPIKKFRPDCPDKLAQLINSTLKKNPGDRPQDALTIAAHLRKIRFKLNKIETDNDYSQTDLIPPNPCNATTDNFVDALSDFQV